MRIVKLSINSPIEGLLRQTPNNDGIWGDYKFVINEKTDECDFWVVYSKGHKGKDSSNVAPENLIFISGEPEPVYHYARSFVKKFGTVITTRKDIKHPRIVFLQPAQPWWVGRKMKLDGSIEFCLNYNDFLGSPKKSKQLSVITSNKGFTKGHIARIKFVEKLKDHFGDSIDVFGRGINGFEDKWDTLKDYKYHIAIENFSSDDYWTEKLSDSYLSEAFPFYFGCRNLTKYFPLNSYEMIDIYDIDKSIKIIETGMKNNFYEVNRKFLLEAKERVLYQHNLFPLICGICDNMNTENPHKTITLRSEMSYFDLYKIPMLIRRFFYKKVYLNFFTF